MLWLTLPRTRTFSTARFRRWTSTISRWALLPKCAVRLWCSRLTVQDEELARKLVELGYRGSGEVRHALIFDHRRACPWPHHLTSFFQLIKREEFAARKREAEASRLVTRLAPMCDADGGCFVARMPRSGDRGLIGALPLPCSVLTHEGIDLSHDPVLQALAEREGPSREGKLTVCAVGRESGVARN